MSYLSRGERSRSTDRRQKVMILRVVNANEDGYNAAQEKKLGPYWASVNPVSERLRVQYQSISVSASHAITIDGRIDVQESDKILFGERSFDILTIKNVDENYRDKVIITQEIRPG